MKTVREAQDGILEKCEVIGTEDVALGASLGRILAEEVTSNRNHPPSDISAMDGYAVRYSDVEGSTKDSPATLTVVDDIRAGMEAKVPVKEGEAARIMTGAPVPDGSDTVIRVEDTDVNRDGDVETTRIFNPSSKGANIRLLGENLRKDDPVLSPGTEIDPATLGTLAMVKRTSVKVHRMPTVAVLSTGDELEGLDEPFDERKIPDANSHTVIAQLKLLGVDAKPLGIARDNAADMEAKLKDGLGYDILIVSGGVSVGHHDFTRPVLESLGVKMHFWRVALRPGHPFAYGTGADTHVFGLPGNPVSSMVCAEQFIVPAIRKMAGARTLFRRTVRARTTGEVKDKAGRLHFMRVKMGEDGGGLTATLTGSQGSGILLSMVEADGLMVVPTDAKLIEAGTTVTVQLLHEGFQKEPGFTSD